MDAKDASFRAFASTPINLSCSFNSSVRLFEFSLEVVLLEKERVVDWRRGLDRKIAGDLFVASPLMWRKTIMKRIQIRTLEIVMILLLGCVVLWCTMMAWCDILHDLRTTDRILKGANQWLTCYSTILHAFFAHASRTKRLIDRTRAQNGDYQQLSTLIHSTLATDTFVWILFHAQPLDPKSWCYKLRRRCDILHIISVRTLW